MSQTYSEILAKVQEFHDKHSFHEKTNKGHDMAYRILLTVEELGEFAECFTKGKPDSEKAEELADLLILIIGRPRNCIQPENGENNETTCNNG